MLILRKRFVENNKEITLNQNVNDAKYNNTIIKNSSIQITA